MTTVDVNKSEHYTGCVNHHLDREHTEINEEITQRAVHKRKSELMIFQNPDLMITLIIAQAKTG